jgi:hypothetical protein
LIALIVSLFPESLARCSRNHTSSSTINQGVTTLPAHTEALLHSRTVDLAFGQ